MLTPAGAIAAAKRAQARAVGARRARGARQASTRRCALCRELGERDGYVLVNSLNPRPHRGPEDGRLRDRSSELGRAPDVLALPFGGGGNVTRGRSRASPRRARAADRRRPGRRARDDAGLGDPDRRARASRRGRRARRRRPRRGRDAHRRRDLRARVAAARAARRASSASRRRAAGLAALARLCARAGQTVVCVLTGHGLKDTGGGRRDAPSVDRRADARGGARRSVVMIRVRRARLDREPRAGLRPRRRRRSTSGTS